MVKCMDQYGLLLNCDEFSAKKILETSTCFRVIPKDADTFFY